MNLFKSKKVYLGHEENIKNFFGENLVNDLCNNTLHHKNIFFLCFTNRSGSNAIAEDISFLYNCSRPTEHFNYQNVIKISRAYKFRYYSDYVYWLFNRHKRKNIGYKISIDQLIFLYEHGILNKLLCNVKYIFVKREDVLSQAISLFIAHNTKIWIGPIPEYLLSKVEFDRQHIIKIIEDILKSNDGFIYFFDKLNIKYHKILYENYCSNRFEEIKKIALFLGLHKKPFTLGEKKVLTQSTNLNSEFKRRFLSNF